MSEEQDRAFFRNFSLVVGGIAVLMLLFFVAASIVVDDEDAALEMRAEKVAEITKPVGTVVIAGQESEAIVEETTAAPAAKTSTVASADPGETVFNGVCTNCHGMPAMAAMMPQIGDAAAWEPRIAKGVDTLYSHAINGYQGDMGIMPAKGGNPALSDDEVKAAVDYIVASVNGPVSKTEESAAPVEAVAAAQENVGEQVYNGLCKNCHSMPAMAAMMPQRGDAEQWGPRIEKGMDTLYSHAINGFQGNMGLMPAKGGNPALSDDEVKAAVDYIVEAIQ